jgi:dipeptidyl aminopeptidase/acylaminoacyl peptidase
MLVTAQNVPPAPQFLYRNENRLVLVNGYTGEATELPIDVKGADYFRWSPDGRYLLALLQDEGIRSCLNLYDVDARVWVYNKPISCGVEGAIFSKDGARIVYSSNNGNNGTLWLHTLADGINQELYRTSGGDDLYPTGISDIQWSPTETYLSFVGYHCITGGILNTFVVLNVESKNHFTVYGADPYYAYYHPIWSKDDRWFLVVLKEEYVTGGVIAFTNHQGDVYLVNAENGDEYRLTYTPADLKYDIHWEDDGSISFSTLIAQNSTFTLEQAMNVEVVPSEFIVAPEPIDSDEFASNIKKNSAMVSPDPNFGAWVSETQAEQGERITELKIGSIPSSDRTAQFSVPISESYQYSNILIGWRPSDYPYPQG